jgi:hypothetical protein
MSFIHQFSYGASNLREGASARDLPEPVAKFQNLDNTDFDEVHEGIVQTFNRTGMSNFLNRAHAVQPEENYDLTRHDERRKRTAEEQQFNVGKLQSMALLQRFIAPTGFAHTATAELFKNDTNGRNFFVIWDLLLNAFEGKTLTALFSVIKAIIASFQDGPKGGDVLECIDNGMRILNKLGRFGPRQDDEGNDLVIHDHEISETVKILLVLARVREMPEHQEVIDELLKKYVLLAEDQTAFEQVTYERLMPKLRSLLAAGNAAKETKAESHNTMVSSPGGGQRGAGGAPAGKPTCKTCGKKGHEEKDCWVKHPEKKKSFDKKRDAKRSTSGGDHGKHQNRGGGGRHRQGGRFRGRGHRGGRDGGQRGGGRSHYDPAAPAHERSGAGAYTGNTEVVDYDSDYYSDERLKYVFSNNTEMDGRKPGDYGDGGADYSDGADVQIHLTTMDPEEEEETEGIDSEDESESEKDEGVLLGAQPKGTLFLRPSRKSNVRETYYWSGDEIDGTRKRLRGELRRSRSLRREGGDRSL